MFQREITYLVREEATDAFTPSKNLIFLRIVFRGTKNTVFRFTYIADDAQYTPRQVPGQDIEWNAQIGYVYESELRRYQFLLLKSTGHDLGDLMELCPSSSWGA